MDILENSLEVFITESGKGVWVCGNTTPFIEDLKLLGGKWNRFKKCWIFTVGQLDQILDKFGISRDSVKREIKSTSTNQSMEVTLKLDEDGINVFICGKTFNIKEDLKGILNAQWIPSKKCWRVPYKSLEKLVKFFNLGDDKVRDLENKQMIKLTLGAPPKVRKIVIKRKK